MRVLFCLHTRTTTRTRILQVSLENHREKAENCTFLNWDTHNCKDGHYSVEYNGTSKVHILPCCSCVFGLLENHNIYNGQLNDIIFADNCQIRPFLSITGPLRA